MPLIVGGAAIAFIVLAMLTLIAIYWILTKWHDFVQGIPLVGGALANVAQYLQDRNEELVRDLFTLAHDIIGWSIDRVNDGFHILHDIWNYGVITSVTFLINQANGLEYWVDSFGDRSIRDLLAANAVTQSWAVGFVNLNINAFNFWRANAQAFTDGWIIPNINKLIATTGIITTVALPALSITLAQVQQQVLDLINGVVKPMRTDLTNLQTTTAITLTAPGVGVLPRLGTVEGDLAKVLPWAAAIGLTIPAALNLAKLASDPCWCTTSGDYQDNGVYELAALMDLL